VGYKARSQPARQSLAKRNFHPQDDTCLSRLTLVLKMPVIAGLPLLEKLGLFPHFFILQWRFSSDFVWGLS